MVVVSLIYRKKLNKEVEGRLGGITKIHLHLIW